LSHAKARDWRLRVHQRRGYVACGDHARGAADLRVLVTGSSGLIGSETVAHFDTLGEEVIGVDNNMRADFFGPDGDTAWNLDRLRREHPLFRHHALDIRNRDAILDLFERERPGAVIHCAAQPSHDLAASRPFDDFDVNAVGTLNLLEATRRFVPDSPFIFMSTNKVYGDAPNELPLVELDTRWDYAQEEDRNGISEQCRIDQSLHSLFGASKVAADVMAQEYGRYFGLKVGIFRGGCLTGPGHSGVELHGFLAYLVQVAVAGVPYRVFGYKGKQVRDQIHSVDVVRAFDAFIASPKPGEVYNLGGGRDNSLSVIESIEMVERMSGCRIDWTYVDDNRVGDHICYISDMSKLRSDFPDWSVTISVERMVAELVESALARRRAAS
jgi:CDP-paratose 2-epimerase